MRHLPVDVDAEASVLSAMIESPAFAGEVSETLNAEDFHTPRNQRVFSAVVELFARGEPTTPVTVANAIVRGSNHAPAEVRDHLIALGSAFSTISEARRDAEIVRDLADLRNLISAGTSISEIGFSKPEDVSKALAESESLIFSVARTATGGERRTKPLASFIAGDLEEIEAMSGRPLLGWTTGFPTLDAVLHGWHQGQLVVIGAQTGHLKTTLMLRFAANAARVGAKVLFVSLEMGGREIRRRLYASEAGIDHSKILTGQLNESWTALTNTTAEVASWHFEMSDKRPQTTQEIAAEARRSASRMGGLDLIVVDYLQRVKPLDRKAQRYEQVGLIAEELKDIAGMTEATVITGAQLNDEINKRKNKRPVMGDIRESRGIEHAADVILFGYWPWRHNPHAQREHYEVIIAKHRQGQTDVVVDCVFDAPKFLLTQGRSRI